MDPSEVPGFPPPTYLADESRAANIIAAAIIPAVVSTSFVALRLYTRLSILKTRLVASDWVLLAACVAAIAYAGGFAGGRSGPVPQDDQN